MHKSYAADFKVITSHNERLEFLGDAVLELVTSDYLYRHYSYPEGVMTSIRAALVRTESICESGKALGYEPIVRLSKGDSHGTERAHDSILADCFEAVIGAIYLDQGYDTARDFIEKHIIVKTERVIKEEAWRDAKSYAQELAQKFDGKTPTYRTLHEEGPDHDKTFTVGLYVGDELLTTAKGHSKQDAQTEAAKIAIKNYREKYHLND